MFGNRAAVLPVGEVIPQLTPVLDVAPNWHAKRRAIEASENVLRDRTFEWLLTLPAYVRPTATGRQYARIVNRISDLWSHCEYTRLYFQSLLIDRRLNRKGFPPEVRWELEGLQDYYFKHLSALPAILWKAVPVSSPFIPNSFFAPYGQEGEIDLRPLYKAS